jgi:hypothetical protein
MEAIVYVEYAPLNSYLVIFTLKGKRTEEVVRANSVSQAKEIIISRYKGSVVKIISVSKE